MLSEPEESMFTTEAEIEELTLTSLLKRTYALLSVSLVNAI